MPSSPRTPALAYPRTSSATNVGADKDSEKRQRAAITAYAKRAGLEVVGGHCHVSWARLTLTCKRRGCRIQAVR